MMAIEKFNKRYEQRIGNDSVYGNGSDGVVVISNTGTPTVITRDMYYSSLTVNSGCTFITNGFRVFVKGELINNGTIGASVGFTTPINPGTVAGQASSVATYSLSQTSDNPLPLSVLHDLENAITGYFVDNAGIVRQFSGGDKGADGTGATSGGAGGLGSAGNAGTGANPGGSGAAGNAGSGGHGGSGAGAGGTTGLPGHWHYAHGGSGVFYNWHSPNHVANPGNSGGNGTGHGGAAGNAGNAGNPGTSGAAGAAGNAGTAGNAGSNGVGGVGGPLVLIVARTISGSGTIISVGQNGINGVAGNPGAAGTGATPGNAGAAGNAGTGANPGNAGVANPGHAGNAGNSGDSYVHAHDSGFHNPGNPFGANQNIGHTFDGFVNGHGHMRTFGGTPGRPANESNSAHFPRHAHRGSSHAFHYTGAAANRAWPRGAVPANVAHFLIGLGHHHSFVSGHNPNTGHNATSNVHHTAHQHSVAAGTAGAAGNAGVAGNAGNPGTNGAAGLAGNPGNPGSNGLSGNAGAAGNAGSQGREGGIIIVTDTSGLTQALQTSAKIIINS